MSFSSFFQTLKTVKAWWHVLKYDVDYDFTSIYPILLFKLQQYRDTLARLQTGEYDASFDEELIKLSYCIDLCNKLIEDDFCKEEYEKHNEKWGIPQITSTKLDSGLIQGNIVRDKAVTEEDRQLERKEFRDLYKLEEERRKSAILSLFLTIANNHRKWWF